MSQAEYLFEPRDRVTGQRIGFPVSVFESCEIISRFNEPGTLQIVGDWDYMVAAFGGLPLQGKGLIVSGNGVEEMTCRLRTAERSGDSQVTMTFDEDTVLLWDRFVRPEPLKAIDKQLKTYYERTGLAEDLIRFIINDQTGPGAIPTRRTAITMTIPASQGRGPSQTIRVGRDKKLGDAVADIAEGAGLRVRMLLREDTNGAPYWIPVIDTTQNVSDEVRFGPVDAGAPGRVADDWTYSITAPSGTRGILGAGGQGEAKIYYEDTLDGDTSNDAWGYNIETYIDAQDLDDLEDIDARLVMNDKLVLSTTWTGIDINRINVMIGNLGQARASLTNNGDLGQIKVNVGNVLAEYEKLDRDTDQTQDLIQEAVDQAVLAGRGDTEVTGYINSLKSIQASYVDAWTSSSDITNALQTTYGNLDSNPDRNAESARLQTVVDLLTVARGKIVTYNGQIGLVRINLNSSTLRVRNDRIAANNTAMYAQTQQGLAETKASEVATANVVDNPLFAYREAWNVGDFIAWSVDGYDTVDRVREVQISLRNSGLFESIKIAVGPPGTSATDDSTVVISQTVTGIVRGVRSLQQR